MSPTTLHPASSPWARIHVLLLWDPSDNGLTVSLEDSRVGDRVQLAVPPDRALDAFYHPFAYAA